MIWDNTRANWYGIGLLANRQAPCSVGGRLERPRVHSKIDPPTYTARSRPQPIFGQIPHLLALQGIQTHSSSYGGCGMTYPLSTAQCLPLLLLLFVFEEVFPVVAAATTCGGQRCSITPDCHCDSDKFGEGVREARQGGRASPSMSMNLKSMWLPKSQIQPKMQT